MCNLMKEVPTKDDPNGISCNRLFPCVPCTGCTLRVNNRMMQLVDIHQGTVLAQIDQRSACTEVCGTHSTGYDLHVHRSQDSGLQQSFSAGLYQIQASGLWFTGSSGGLQAPQGRYQRGFTRKGLSGQRCSVGSAAGTTPRSTCEIKVSLVSKQWPSDRVHPECADVPLDKVDSGVGVLAL